MVRNPVIFSGGEEKIGDDTIIFVAVWIDHWSRKHSKVPKHFADFQAKTESSNGFVVHA